MEKWGIWLMSAFLGLGVNCLRAEAQDPGATQNGSATQTAVQNNIQSQLNLDPQLTLDPPRQIWDGGVGDGYMHGTREAGFTLGAGPGMKFAGSDQSHDLALAALRYGWVFTGVIGRGHWYQGNGEVLGELWAGSTWHPGVRYVVGFTPILRYSFATGTRWIPFLDAGAGVAGTSIGAPDLSTTFEFNLQGGAGVNYFLRDNVAIGLQYRLFHLSNASIKDPNQGVNVNMISVGMSWFF